MRSIVANDEQRTESEHEPKMPQIHHFDETRQRRISAGRGRGLLPGLCIRGCRLEPCIVFAICSGSNRTIVWYRMEFRLKSCKEYKKSAECQALPASRRFGCSFGGLVRRSTAQQVARSKCTPRPNRCHRDLDRSQTVASPIPFHDTSSEVLAPVFQNQGFQLNKFLLAGRKVRRHGSIVDALRTLRHRHRRLLARSERWSRKF